MELEDALETVKYLLVGVNVLLFVVGAAVFASSPRHRVDSSAPGNAGPRRALLVTAHPDDESMFFLPLLRSLEGSDDATGAVEWRVYLLVLSRGNFDGLGAEREAEMRACAAFLGLSPENVAVLEDPELQDGMQNDWSAAYIAKLVLAHVDRHNIDAVFTFDAGGVSGHPNHIATFHGVKEALRLRHERCDVRRSAGEEGRDAAPSTTPGATPDDAAFVFSFRPAWNYRAMALHRSQFVWYRRLFVIFSRYTFVNTFQPIHCDDQDGKKDN